MASRRRQRARPWRRNARYLNPAYQGASRRSCHSPQCCPTCCPHYDQAHRDRLITHSIESRTSWSVATVSFILLGMSFGAPWITAVGLKAIAAEMGGARSVPALANSIAWFGTAAGGIVMGRLAATLGVRPVVMVGSLMISIGLAISTLGQPWQLYVGHGLFIGLLGNACLNAPLYVYVSRWFDRRRGSALALISAGSYLAGFVWPPIFERAIANFGWRWTMLTYAVLQLAVIVPLAALFLRPPP